jgi:predicted YcjX-like family ATPase
MVDEEFAELCDDFESMMLSNVGRETVADQWYYVCIHLINNPAAPYARFAEVARMYSEYLRE